MASLTLSRIARTPLLPIAVSLPSASLTSVASSSSSEALCSSGTRRTRTACVEVISLALAASVAGSSIVSSAASFASPACAPGALPRTLRSVSRPSSTGRSSASAIRSFKPSFKRACLGRKPDCWDWRIPAAHRPANGSIIVRLGMQNRRDWRLVWSRWDGELIHKNPRLADDLTVSGR